jgi:hypothetical protein
LVSHFDEPDGVHVVVTMQHGVREKATQENPLDIDVRSPPARR